MALQVRVLCDVSSLPADAAAVDLLARLQLAARRHGSELRLAGASRALRELIALCGLETVLPGELERQSEQREEPLGVQEERQLRDSPL
jgi:ABC-type transporter Mla MlaB component